MALLNLKLKPLVCILAFALLFICTNGTVFAKKRMPRFKDYPVSGIYEGKNARLKIHCGDEFGEIFSDRLQWAVDNQRVNFAGRYIVTNWSCGTWCNMGAVIDAKTGKVYWAGVSLNKTCWEGCSKRGESIEHRINSKLIIFYGRRGDKDGDNGAHYFKFENGRFVHLRSVLSKEQRREKCVKTTLCG